MTLTGEKCLPQLLMAQSQLDSETQAIDCMEKSPLASVQYPLNQAAEFRPSPRCKLRLYHFDF